MAMQAENVADLKAKAAAELRAKEVEAAQKKADDENKGREGKGTRKRVGQTRGKNPQVISWEEFDESKPETLPVSLKEFSELAKVSEPIEKNILRFAIIGYNDDAYTSASDPIAEYVDLSWPDEIQKNFRQVVRNYSQGANVSIEDAVALIRPGIVSAVAKAKENPPAA